MLETIASNFLKKQNGWIEVEKLVATVVLWGTNFFLQFLEALDFISSVYLQKHIGLTLDVKLNFSEH